MKQRSHVVISGTGRAGTSFLMLLLTRLGLDTGFKKNKEISLACRAGLEKDIREPDAPHIVKSPAFCHYVGEVLARADIRLERVIVPIRDLKAAAESRRQVTQEALSRGRRLEDGIPGGLWRVEKGEDQEQVLLEALYKLLFHLSKSNVPITLLHYPRLVSDSRYLYGKLRPILGSITYQAFTEVFESVLRPDWTHQFTPNDRWAAEDRRISTDHATPARNGSRDLKIEVLKNDAPQTKDHDFKGTIPLVFLTRFNLVLPFLEEQGDAPPPAYFDEWLHHRTELFEEFCLPSLRKQTDQRFYLALLLDEHRTPDWLMRKVREWALWEPLFPCTVNVPFSTDLPPLFTRKLLEAAGHWPVRYVATGWLDSDDVISPRYVEKMRRHFPRDEEALLCFPGGYRTSIETLREGLSNSKSGGLEVTGKNVAVIDWPKRTTAMVRVEKVSGNGRFGSVFEKPHHLWVDFKRVEDICPSERHFVKLVHPDAVINIPERWFGRGEGEPFRAWRNRTELIEWLISRFGFQSYLEIGIGNGKNFENVPARKKVGVDPKACEIEGVLQTSSDSFFEQNRNGFDLIFVDGLHERDQFYRDCENALAVVNEGGLVLCHDINPRNEVEQRVPRESGAWTGDCWKAWVELRKRPDVEMFAIDLETGMGVIRRGRQISFRVPGELSWQHLKTNKRKWLNLQNHHDAKRRLTQWARDHGNKSTRTAISRVFIAGFQKCATTAVFRCLEDHPDVVIPQKTGDRWAPFLPKETEFFSKNFGRGLAWYESLFVGKGSVTLEATPTYIASREILQRIAEWAPDAKFVLMLRDPVERAFSAWNQWNQLEDKGVWRMPVPDGSFSDNIQREFEKNLSAGPYFGLLKHGLYVNQIRQLFSLFDPSQVFIGFKEELDKKPETVTSDIQEFLGLRPVRLKLRLANHIPYVVGKMPDNVQKWLTRFYRDSVLELKELLGRELPWSRW